MRAPAVILVASLVVCLAAASSAQPGDQGGLPDDYPYGDVLNNDDPLPMPEEAPPKFKQIDIKDDKMEPSLRCVEILGDNRGVDISCDDVCDQVCKGRTDCPCNDNGRSTMQCWVPRTQAKELCKDIEDCRVISYFDGPEYRGLPFYKDWAHLGDTPIVPAVNFRATLCDKSYEDDKAGCYACQADCSASQTEACQKCFQESHDTLSYDTSKDYCEPHDGRETSTCEECSCCNFVARGLCDFAGGICEAPRGLCSARVQTEVQSASLECETWLNKVQIGLLPKQSETCECMRHVRPKLQYNVTSAKYDCSFAPDTQPFQRLLGSCDVAAPCSGQDDCTGCKTYQSGHHWLPLVHPITHTDFQCAYHPFEHKCVVVGDDGVRNANYPCSIHNGTINYGTKEWWWSSARRFDAGPPVHDGVYTPGPEKVRDPFDEDKDARGDPLSYSHHVRKAPRKSDKVAPSPPPYRDDYPRPIPTDLDNTTIGNEISHRHFVDAGNSTINFALTCVEFSEAGFIEAWEVYAARKGIVHAQVLREVPSPADLDRNEAAVRAFEVVGENLLYIDGLGKHIIDIPRCERIEVQPGDIIGFYSVRRGVVSYSSGGQNVLYRYGAPSAPTYGVPSHGPERKMKYDSDGKLVFVGDGAERTYSVAARGKFGRAAAAKRAWEAVHTTPCDAQPVIPLSPSPSPLPSPLPHPPLNLDPCNAGPSYWCQDRIRKYECRINTTRYERVCYNRTGKGEGGGRNVLDGVGATPVEGCLYCQGGSDWGGLCATGREQSPINISWADVKIEESFKQFVRTNYFQQDVTIINSAHALTIQADFGTLLLDDSTYAAELIMIRGPSEHQVEGWTRPSLELQILHREIHTKKMLIVSVLFDEAMSGGGDNVEMSRLLAAEMPKQVGGRVEVTGFNLNNIVDQYKPAVIYDGSLPIPPCTEGVTWFVQMGDNAKLSWLEISRVNDVFKNNPDYAQGRGNNRMRQPLNGRQPVVRRGPGCCG